MNNWHYYLELDLKIGGEQIGRFSSNELDNVTLIHPIISTISNHKITKQKFGNWTKSCFDKIRQESKPFEEFLQKMATTNLVPKEEVYKTFLSKITKNDLSCTINEVDTDNRILVVLCVSMEGDLLDNDILLRESSSLDVTLVNFLTDIGIVNYNKNYYSLYYFLEGYLKRKGQISYEELVSQVEKNVQQTNVMIHVKQMLDENFYNGWYKKSEIGIEIIEKTYFESIKWRGKNTLEKRIPYFLSLCLEYLKNNHARYQDGSWELDNKDKDKDMIVTDFMQMIGFDKLHPSLAGVGYIRQILIDKYSNRYMGIRKLDFYVELCAYSQNKTMEQIVKEIKITLHYLYAIKNKAYINLFGDQVMVQSEFFKVVMPQLIEL